MVGVYYRHRILIDLIVSISLSYAFSVRRIGHDSIFMPISADHLHNMLLCLFSTSTALMGFVLAAGTFLISHVKDDAFQVLRKSKSFPSLIKLISSSIWRLFGLASVSLLMIFAGPAVYAALEATTVFFTIWAGLSLTSLLWIIIQILLVPTRS